MRKMSLCVFVLSCLMSLLLGYSVMTTMQLRDCIKGYNKLDERVRLLKLEVQKEKEEVESCEVTVFKQDENLLKNGDCDLRLLKYVNEALKIKR